MTNEELALKIQRGGYDLMPQLWAQVKAFVYRRANVAFVNMPPGCGVDVDDLVQDGYIAVDCAVKDFDPEKGSFLTWLDYFLKSEFDKAAGRYRTEERDGVRRRIPRDALNGAASLDTPLDQADAGSDTLADTVADPRDDCADMEERIYQEQLAGAIHAAVDRLPPVSREIVRRRYFHGETAEHIAEVLGLDNGQAVYGREKRALEAIRNSSDGVTLSGFLYDRIDYYRGVSARRFLTRGASSVENAVFARERLRRTWERRQNKERPEA